MTNRPNFFYLGNNRALIELHTGASFIVDTESIDISVPLIRSGCWEPFIETHIKGLIGGGSNIIDVGANMGYFSVTLGHAVGPTGNLFAFEPNPQLFDCLQSNLFINGIDSRYGGHCSATNVALSADSKTEDYMWVHPREKGGGFITSDKETDLSKSGYVKTRIELRRLDDCVPPDMQFDLIKIDVEGHEPNVLYGAADVLDRSDKVTLVIEFSPNAWRSQGHEPSALIEYLQGFGFSFALATIDGKLTGTDAEHLIEKTANLGYCPYLFANKAR